MHECVYVQSGWMSNQQTTYPLDTISHAPIVQDTFWPIPGLHVNVMSVHA